MASDARCMSRASASGEPLEGIKNVFLLDEKMMLQSKTPVEPPEAIKQDYQSYGIRCGYVI
jgi:hypothetical protein